MLQQPPLLCLGHSRGRRGTASVRARGHEVCGGHGWPGASSPCGDSPPSLLPAGCPRARHSLLPCPTRSRTRPSLSPSPRDAGADRPGWDSLCGGFPGTPCSLLSPEVRQIPPVPGTKCRGGTRSEIIRAHSEWRMVEWFGWEGTLQTALPWEQNLLSPLFPAPSTSCSPRPQSCIPEPVPAPVSALVNEKTSEGSN